MRLSRIPVGCSTDRLRRNPKDHPCVPSWKPLEAGGVNLSDALLALLLRLDLTVAQGAFEVDGLAFLKGAGETCM